MASRFLSPAEALYLHFLHARTEAKSREPTGDVNPFLFGWVHKSPPSGIRVSCKVFSGSRKARCWSNISTTVFFPLRMVPRLSRMLPWSRCIKVVLPQPLGPMIPKRSPFLRMRESMDQLFPIRVGVVDIHQLKNGLSESWTLAELNLSGFLVDPQASNFCFEVIQAIEP